jgi:hypothetical protein
MLPSAFRPWVADVAERMQCPADYPAAAGIVAAASLVGRRCAIRPKCRDDWMVVPNLWGAAVGPPSAMKSPAVEEMLRPVRALEAAAANRFSDEHQDYEADRILAKEDARIRKGDIKVLLKDGRREEATTLARQARNEDEPPTRRRPYK